MDLEEIKKYLKLMKEYELSEFTYKKKEFKIILKKQLNISTSEFSSINSTKLNKLSNKNNSSSKEKTFLSPLVGVFYQAASPTSEPFVKLKQKISKDNVLCIIESMKVMNEILADFDGEITEILVKDGESVEYNQALFKYK